MNRVQATTFVCFFPLLFRQSIVCCVAEVRLIAAVEITPSREARSANRKRSS